MQGLVFNIQVFFKHVKQIIVPRKRMADVLGSLLAGTFLLGLPSNGLAAFEDLSCNARLGSLAGASVALTGQSALLFNNPASLWRNSGYDFHFSYSRPFGLPDLKLLDFSTGFRFHQLAPGIALRAFSVDQYRETLAAAGISYRILPHSIIGVSTTWYHLQISGYGQTQTMAFHIGGHVQILNRVALAFAAKNQFQTHRIAGDESLPRILVIGTTVQLAPPVHLIAEWCQESSFANDLRTGMELSLHRNFTLRVAAATVPSRMCFGMGLQLGDILLDYGFQSHSDLGLTHFFSVTFLRK